MEQRPDCGGEGFIPAVLTGLNGDPREYLVGKIIGEGGQHVIREAWEILEGKLSSQYALKTTQLDRKKFKHSSDFLRGLQSREKYINHEIQFYHRFNDEEGRHQMLLPFHADGYLQEHDDHPATRCFIVDYIPHHVNNQKEHTLYEALNTGLAAADFTAWLHKQHLAYHDLKLLNIGLTDTGEFRFYDFETVSEDATPPSFYAGYIMGSPDFVAPEIFLDYFDYANDQFSLGMLIFKLFHPNNDPFYSEDMQEEAKNYGNTNLIEYRARARDSLRYYHSRDIPDDLNNIIEILLSYYPENRYHCMTCVFGELYNIAEQYGISYPLRDDLVNDLDNHRL